MEKTVELSHLAMDKAQTQTPAQAESHVSYILTWGKFYSLHFGIYFVDICFYFFAKVDSKKYFVGNLLTF